MAKIPFYGRNLEFEDKFLSHYEKTFCSPLRQSIEHYLLVSLGDLNIPELLKTMSDDEIVSIVTSAVKKDLIMYGTPYQE